MACDRETPRRATRTAANAGVKSVECGYTGGKREHPTYHSMKDHTEAVRVVFDPRVVSLAKLLDQFWDEHSPFSGRTSCQYRAAVWYHSAEQLKTIEASRDTLLKESGARPSIARALEETLRRARGAAGKTLAQLSTAIEPAGPFYRAEEYHQKYYKKHMR